MVPIRIRVFFLCCCDLVGIESLGKNIYIICDTTVCSMAFVNMSILLEI